MTIEHLIRDEAYRVGEGQHKVICPLCSHERKKKRERTLSIKVENQSIYTTAGTAKPMAWCLWRRDMPAQRSNKVALAVKHDWDDLSKNVIDWLSKRGISEETARTAKIKSGQHYIRSIGKEVECAVFPYMNQERMYAAKVRAVQDKGLLVRVRQHHSSISKTLCQRTTCSFARARLMPSP